MGKYQAQKKSLDALIATETKQKAQLAAKKKDILAKLANLKALAGRRRRPDRRQRRQHQLQVRRRARATSCRWPVRR